MAIFKLSEGGWDKARRPFRSGYSGTAPAWVDNTLANFDYDAVYSDSVTASGEPDVNYEISAGSLPTGISLDQDTGALSGTPSVLESYSFTITASNPLGSVSQAFSGQTGVAPSWVDETLANITYNTAYSDGVEASGVPTPSYSISAGALPTGLSLNTSTGAITGTPTAAGDFTFTVTATNSVSSISKEFTFSTPALITGGTETTYTGYMARTFTTTGQNTLTIEGGSPVTAAVMAISGGYPGIGGSGEPNPTRESGGAAGARTISDVTFAPGTYYVNVGSATASSNIKDQPGSTTLITASGRTPGTLSGVVYGMGGGRGHSGGTRNSQNGVSGAANNYRTGSNETRGGGGGGAGWGGSNPGPFPGGSGGSGGGGPGRGPSQSPSIGSPGTPTTGSGGGGTWSGPQGAGAPGMVVIRFADTDVIT